MTKIAAALCLLQQSLLAAAARAGRGVRVPSLHRASLASIPVRMYAQDCWQHRSPTLAFAQGEASLPGAGMNPAGLVPFQTVLKDGFFMVDCVKDYLLSHGDKFGDGKYSYRLGQVSNVSIVHYTDIIAKEDRKTMTHEVCFEFCRTVPDMLVFGITNGRDCYCAPFFKPMAGDSTQCDSVCEGDMSQMCGGKFKTTIFEMHACEDVAANLDQAGQKAGTARAALAQGMGEVQAISGGMQRSAAALQAAFGQVGDLGATALMQAAKVFAGELGHAASAKQAILDGIASASGRAALAAQGAGLGAAAEAREAEFLTESLEKFAVDAEDAVEELEGLARASSASVGADGNVSAAAEQQYYPLMYFVDKAHTGEPTTCAGDAVGRPMTALAMGDCAQACDAQIHACVGFSFYTSTGTEPNLCFLFSKFKEATHYTGCGGSSFLQKRASGAATGAGVSCMAKLSKFEGTSIAPDGSGKCEGCLKTVTAAARCPF